MVVCLASAGALAQVPPEPYVDDSTLATETLAQLDDLLRAGSRAEAARALQSLLDDQPDRLVPASPERVLFIPVRDAVHDALLARPELLATYTEQQGPAARRAVEQGRHREAEHTRLLTDPGFEAALRVAQEQLEDALFQSAWRTLRQLDRHPLIESPDHAAEAVVLASIIASYLDHGEAARTAERWARVAGTTIPGAVPIDPPVGLHAGDRPALTPFTEADLTGVVPSPLHSIVLPSAKEWAAQADRGAGQRSFWVLPSILENTVYLNDGEAVLALDRFTLRRLWRTPTPAAQPDSANIQNAQRQRNRTRLIEDPSTVTAHDRVVIAPLGHVVSGRREGDNRVVCLDRADGGVRWSVDPGELSLETAGASIRGPVVIDGQTAIVSLRKNERSRRIIGVYLAGLDLDDGSLRWLRLVGSVGALPYQQQTRSAQAVRVNRGVAFLTDEIGLAIAVDTDSGRPLWLRRSPGLVDQGVQPNPWAVQQPLPDGDAIIAVTPDRFRVRRLDHATGRELASRSVRHVGHAVYLLDAPGHPGAIAVVGETRIVFLDRESLEETTIPRLEIASTHGVFTGRVLAAGDRLVAPVETGVLVLAPGQPHEHILLDATGNAAVAPGQILVVDDTRLRSYLVWGVASSMLKQRIEDNPADPAPAVTFAELAHRANRTEELLPAIDLALSAIDRAGPTGRTRATASRLFGAVLGMVDDAHRGWFDPDTDGDAAGPVGPLVAQLIDRLGRLADAPSERVAHILALGRQHEASGRPADAAATYQQLLSDRLLASTPWRGPRVSVRAELEAERRLHALVRASGFAVYAQFDREARDAYQAVDKTDPAALEHLARRYPLSPIAAQAGLDNARAHLNAGDARRAIRAGAKAVETLRRLDRDGVAVTPALLGRVYGAQIVALARANRPEEAGALAAEAADHHPGLALLDGDKPIETDALFREIAERLASRRLKPRFGPTIVGQDEPQLIKGYTLRPLARAEPGGAERARFDGVLVVSQDEGSLTWYTPMSEDGPLTPAWSRLIEGKPDPLLLRIDEVSAWVFWPTQSGGWLERITLEDGSPMWASPPWDTLVLGVPTPDEDENAGRARFIDPVEGRVRADELLLTMDARTIIIVERGGRAAAVDSASGDTLWAAPLPLIRIHDVDTTGGVFAIGGVGTDRRGEFGPMLATLDPRTGEPIHVDDAVSSEVRWTRVTASGDLLAGLRDRIVSVSPAEGRLNYELVNPQTVETDDAWLVGDALLVRAPDDDIWMADTRTGMLRETPLDTRGRINTADRVVVEPVDAGILLASSDGVCVFDSTGELVGVDAFIQPARVMPAVVAEDTAAVLKIERGRFGLGGTRFVMHLLEPGTARVLDSFTLNLFGEPTAVDAIDGRLLVNAGEVTVVLRAPTR